MSQHDREEARYEQGYAAGSRASQSNPATGIFVGILIAAVLGLGAWFVLTQTGQKPGEDIDIINVPTPEAPEAPEVNIDVPTPDISAPKIDIDVPTPPAADNNTDQSSSTQSQPAPSEPSSSSPSNGGTAPATNSKPTSPEQPNTSAPSEPTSEAATNSSTTTP